MVVRPCAIISGSILPKHVARQGDSTGKYGPAHGGGEAPEKRRRGNVEVAAGGMMLTGREVGRDVQDRIRSRHGLQRRLWASIGSCTFASVRARPTGPESMLRSSNSTPRCWRKSLTHPHGGQSRCVNTMTFDLDIVNYSAKADSLCEVRNTRSTT